MAGRQRAGSRVAALRWLARVRLWAVPGVLLLCVTLPHLDDGDWMRGDSGWYAAIAAQAWETGGLWTLRAAPGQAYFNKPPLAFWIVGLVMDGLGANAWTARLPTVFAALCVVVLAVAVAKRLGGRGAAIGAGVVLPLTYEFFRRTREISLDMWQLVFLTACVLLVARASTRPPGRAGAAWMLAAGAPLGLALLTKPLVGLVALPLLGVWLVWIGRRRRAAWLGGTLAVALCVAGPWHVSMVAAHGEDFWRQYFGAEIAERAASAMAGASSDPLFYVRQLAEGYWPWLAFVALAIWWWLRRGAITRGGRLERLAVVWAGGWLVLLSAFPDRRDRYALVLFPALAWLAGIWLGRWVPAGARPVARGAVRWGPIGLVGAAVVVAALPIHLHRPINPQWPALYRWIESRGGERLWQGDLSPGRGARLYLRYGWWPRPTRNRWGQRVAEPARGGLLIYHDGDGLDPGAGEEVLFESGDLTVTRLDGERWAPVRTPR